MNAAGDLDEIEMRAAASILALHCQHLEKENAEIKDLTHALAGVLWRLEKNGYIRDIEYGDEETADELANLMIVGMKSVDDARAKLGQPKREVPNAEITGPALLRSPGLIDGL